MLATGFRSLIIQYKFVGWIVIATRAQIVAKKMAVFNNAFSGSSGGHETCVGGVVVVDSDERHL